jgi:CheY-like chemotaxis protein
MLRSRRASAPLIAVEEKPIVLIVEEHSVLRSASAKRLRAAGFEVVEATNSAEAQEILKSTVVDAMLSDIPKPPK